MEERKERGRKGRREGGMGKGREREREGERERARRKESGRKAKQVSDVSAIIILIER